MPEEANRFPLTVEGIERAVRHGSSLEARRSYIETLRSRIAEYERKYKMPSDELRDAIASGVFAREDLGLAKWLLAIQGLEQVLEADKEADPEG